MAKKLLDWERGLVKYSNWTGKDVPWKSPELKKQTQKQSPRIVPTAEPMVLQSKHADVVAQIARLKKEERSLRKQLRLLNQKPLDDTGYLAKPIKLYVLRLENDCWYIGMSRNVSRRFNKHLAGKGAKWTKLHAPIEVYEVRETDSTLDEEVAIMEDQLTIEYAIKYGTDKVRGGGYCQSKPRWPESAYHSTEKPAIVTG